ncbi:sigma-70 family RNA polymerase sigma factor [Engelhardtia mirabilis]|uniref:RNA polymerase sigma factor n=1 Tax=Engelhardtia mirabilis TaxID=2528011 RepID=A0A518BNJ9_9BACT|nr:ECF RNA polymerase sigma factor SigE [Planctomycetes bacterium Pla133]QDV02880.1 ECF RNA polymerase sigma factor SigE [Planctomycetes bacterium Pla86]
MNDLSTRHFLTWRGRRDAASLEAVFDATAPGLLRLALHLVGDAQVAEDLVQQTFLAAIEAPELFDAARGVEAWLAGILANRARRVHRDRARRIDPERVERALAAADPAELAANRELSAAVLEALDALDEPYRQAAVLRLVHGLEPAQIAHALGRAPGTVRVQLHRALEQLRRALPTGAALGILPLFDARASLAGVREAVLAAGTKPGLVAGSLTALTHAGALIVTTKIWIAAAAAAVSLLALIVFEGGRDAAPAAPTASPEAGGDALVALTTPADTERSALLSSAVDVPGAHSPIGSTVDDSAADGSVTIHIHADGRPVAGRELRLRVDGPDPELNARWRKTDERGLAVVDRLPPCSFAVEVAGGIWRDGAIGRDESKSIEIDLAQLARVEGNVVDALDEPIAGARILALNRHAPPMEVAVSDADGRFTIDGAGSDLRLVAEHPDYHVLDTVWADAKPRTTIDVRLVMHAESAVLEGLAVDERGDPVPGTWAELALWTEVEMRRRGEGITLGLRPRAVRVDDQGRFRFESLPAATVAVGARAPGRVGESRTVELEPGRTTRVTLRLTDGATVAGHVRDPQGRPLAGAQVAGPSGVEFARVTTLTDGDGAFRLDGVEPDPEATITARRAGADESGARATRALRAGELTTVELTLAPDARIGGRLRGPDGEPLAGWWVAFETRGDLVARGRQEATGADGSFEVDAAGTEPGCLVAMPPARGGLPPVAERCDVRPGDRVDLWVESERFPDAGFRIAVVDGAGRPLSGAQIGYAVEREGYPTMGSLEPVEPATGVLEVGQLAPGPVRVEVRTADRGRLSLGEVELRAGELRDLGTAAILEAGNIDLSWRPTADVVEPAVFARSTESPGLTEAATRMGDGRWRVGPLQPGTYDLLLVDRDGEPLVPCRGLVVVAGETLELGQVALD